MDGSGHHFLKPLHRNSPQQLIISEKNQLCGNVCERGEEGVLLACSLSTMARLHQTGKYFGDPFEVADMSAARDIVTRSATNSPSSEGKHATRYALREPVTALPARSCNVANVKEGGSAQSVAACGKSNLLATSSVVSDRNTCGNEDVGSATCRTPPPSHLVASKPLPVTSQYGCGSAAISSPTADAGYHRAFARAAAARPAVASAAAHMVRVSRPICQTQRKREEQQGTRDNIVSPALAPPIVQRQNDPELQQIARQELDVSDDDTAFTLGDIIERPPQQKQQHHSQNLQYHTQHVRPEGGPHVAQQQILWRPPVDGGNSTRSEWEGAQPGFAGSPDATAAASAPGAPASAASASAVPASAASAAPASAAPPLVTLVAPAAAAVGHRTLLNIGSICSSTRGSVSRSSKSSRSCDSSSTSTNSSGTNERASEADWYCAGVLSSQSAAEAPMGFPQPVHRSVLQQQLQQLRAKEPARFQKPLGMAADKQLKMEDDYREEAPQQQWYRGSMKGGPSLEKSHNTSGALHAPADIDIKHSKAGGHWLRHVNAEDDRASIEAEATELLRSMQPREIAAARQELLDRFGPKRFAVLQRRALLRRAAPPQQQAPSPHHTAEVFENSACEQVGAYTLGVQKYSTQRFAFPCLKTGTQEVSCVPSSISGETSDDGLTHLTGSAAGTRENSTHLPYAAANSAALEAYVYFTRNGGSARGISRQPALASPRGGDEAFADNRLSSEAAASDLSAVPEGGAAARLRFDIHEAAKLRWTDPLGPEDWRGGDIFGKSDGLYGTAAASGHRGIPRTTEQKSCKDAVVPSGATKEAPRLHHNAEGRVFRAYALDYDIRLERLRYDFDGRLRSDVLHLQDTVRAAVAGVRVVEIEHQRRSCIIGGLLKGVEQRSRCQKFLDKRLKAQQQRGLLHRRAQHGKRSEVSTTRRGKSGLASYKQQLNGERNLGLLEDSPRDLDGEGDNGGAQSAAINAEPSQEQCEESFDVNSDDSDPLEFYRGLHHHGEAAALPGYTVCELLYLAQSSSRPQAALALQTLAAVLRSGRVLFSCPSLADAATFAASMCRWADHLENQPRPPGPEMLPAALRGQRSDGPSKEKELQQEERPSSRVEQHAHAPTQHHAGVLEPRDLGGVDVVAGLGQDNAAEAKTSILLGKENLFSVREIDFEARAGYGLGLRRWFDYVARDLYLAWRLHTLLHAHSPATHRASLCCLAAFFGPPALSGLVRRCVAAHGFERFSRNGVTDESAAGGSGKGDGVICDECSQRGIIATAANGGLSVEGKRYVNGRVSAHSNNSDSNSSSGSSAGGIRVEGVDRFESAAAIESRKQRIEVVTGDNVGLLQQVSGDEYSDLQAEGASASGTCPCRLLRAFQGEQTACWGPGVNPLPLHLTTLPQHLTTEVVKAAICGGKQQPERWLPKLQPLQKCAEERAAEQQTLHHVRTPRRGSRQRKRDDSRRPAEEEIDYVCVWGLGGWDFVTEGLLVDDCCSGLRNIDLSAHVRVSRGAAAVGGNSSPGCRGVFAFWHALIGRMGIQTATTEACSQQKQQRLLQETARSCEDSEQCSVGDTLNTTERKQNPREEARKTAVASFPVTSRNTTERELASIPTASEDNIEAESCTASGKTTEATENRRLSHSSADLGRAGLCTSSMTVMRSRMLEDSIDDTVGAVAGESDAATGESPNALLYGSVGELFSSSPAEALVEHGKVLQRLAVLLSIYHADENFERHALQLLLGLSAAGPASIACMLSHAPLQARIRSLAEGLLMGSAARTERLQKQTLHHNLAVAASRAAESSNTTASGVFFAARAELQRHLERRTSSIHIERSTSSTQHVKRSSSSTQGSFGYVNEAGCEKATWSSGLRAATTSRSHYCHDKRTPNDFSSEPTLKEKESVPQSEKDGNVSGYLLRHSEYLLLRELLLLLRLWAEWETPGPYKESTSAEAARAATSWEETLIGRESACCALLLQALTDGLFRLEAAGDGGGPPLICDVSVDLKSNKEGPHAEGVATLPTINTENYITETVTSFDDEDERGRNVPTFSEEAAVIIAAVEAARALRLLEGRGALPHMFATFYPSTVKLLHSFATRLGKLQEELLRAVRRRAPQVIPATPKLRGHQQSWKHRRREEVGNAEHRDMCELELELQQQMQELQQQETPQHECGDAAASHLSGLLEGTTSLGLTGQFRSTDNVAVSQHSGTNAGNCSGGELDGKINIRSKQMYYQARRGIKKHEVAFVWVFHGTFMKELLRWAAVAAAREDVLGEDAHLEGAHELLLKVAPIVRVIPSLLICWKRLIESGCGQQLNPFAHSCAVQVVHAATRLCMIVSRTVARALCCCSFGEQLLSSSSSSHYESSIHPKSASGGERDPPGTPNSAGNSEMSGPAEPSSERGSHGVTVNCTSGTGHMTTDATAKRQAVVISFWIKLMKPIAVIFSGRTTVQTNGCCRAGAAGCEDCPAAFHAETTMGADTAAVEKAREAAEGGCGIGQPEMVQQRQEDGDNKNKTFGSEKQEGGKTCGLLLRLMYKMTCTCNVDGGRSIARALARYAIETGWTSQTTCCCTQCVPYLSHEDTRDKTVGGSPLPTWNSSRTLRRSRWRGLLPATSESFAGTEVLDYFSALSNVRDRCDNSAFACCGGQKTSDVHCNSLAAPNFNAHSCTCTERSHSSSSGSDHHRAPSKGDKRGNAREDAERLATDSRPSSNARLSSGRADTCNNSTLSSGLHSDNASVSDSSIDIAAMAMLSSKHHHVPQDIELFLSEASFVGTACNWVAASLHVLHHCREGVRATFSANGTEETEFFSSSCVNCSESLMPHEKCSAADRGGQETCEPSSCRDKTPEYFHSCDETHFNGNGGSPSTRLARPCASDREENGELHNIFSPSALKRLSEAAAHLASTLRQTLHCLFQELRWPQQSHLPLTHTRRTAADVSTSACPELMSQQQHLSRSSQNVVNFQPQHSVNPLHLQKQVRTCQNQATVTSQPLILFEPLAQLLLALLVLLRTCARFVNDHWDNVAEQQCLLAACSAAATPRTFLRGLLIFYDCMKAASSVYRRRHTSSLMKIEQHGAFVHGRQEDTTACNPISDAANGWLKGAAQWFIACCDLSLLVPRHNPDVKEDVVPLPGSTQNAVAYIYNLLVRSIAQSGLAKEQRQQEEALCGNAAGSTSWPKVLCALDVLDILVNDDAKLDEDRFSSDDTAEVAQAYRGATLRRSRRTLYSEQFLAVCPIDGIVGGSIWQCFCCGAVPEPDPHPPSQNADSVVATLSQSANEVLPLCEIVVHTPNLAQELHRNYLPPSIVFAAVVALYTDSQMFSASGDYTNYRVLPRAQEVATAVGRPRKASALNIYARPAVYHLFCKLLDKLLLQPLGKQLRRTHAPRPPASTDNRRRTQGPQEQQQQAYQEVNNRQEVPPCWRRNNWQKKTPREAGGRREQQMLEVQEEHQHVEPQHDADGPVEPSALLPCDGTCLFSRSFLSVVCEACQIESCVTLEDDAQRSAPCDPEPRSVADALTLCECLPWVPLCCNKAQDVLIDQTARLLRISQDATDAADPLLSLLLWLLSSPAFPFECRRMLVREDQTWLKVASQLFCIACDVDDTRVPVRADQQRENPLEEQELQRSREPLVKTSQQPEEPHDATQLPSPVLKRTPRGGVEWCEQPAELQRQAATTVCISQLASQVSGTITRELCAPVLFPGKASCWGMQSPRGDVFWFTSPDSLYVTLPGLWKEDDEEILAGWSAFVQNRLQEGFLLPEWRQTCKHALDGTGLGSQSTLASGTATSLCFIALFPLHALALLVADEMSFIAVPVPLPSVTRSKDPHEPDPRQQRHVAKPQQKQDLLKQDLCYTPSTEHPSGYSRDTERFTKTSEARLKSASTHPRQKLPTQNTPCEFVREARRHSRTVSSGRESELETRRSELKYLLRAPGASSSCSGSDAVAAEVAAHIARIIWSRRVVALYGEHDIRPS